MIASSVYFGCHGKMSKCQTSCQTLYKIFLKTLCYQYVVREITLLLLQWNPSKQEPQ